MLRRSLLRAWVGVGVLFSVSSVRAAGPQEHPPELHRPGRLTVGTNDQFLGQLAPAGDTLYFVSNRATRREIYAQDLEDGRVRQVFDEAADVSWPRVSPDGKHLLYISYSQRATGQLCVRDLPEAGERRCVEDEGTALQAEWIDATHLVLIGRTSIDGNLRVSKVSVAKGELTRRTLFERNWTSPAVSADGRWLVYVPLDRVTTRVGPGFAARAERRLEAVRLDRQSEPFRLVMDLPGMTGQPAFSPDGSSLYFVQFMADSNRDGVIDASDHGVLFRAPFPSTADDAPARAMASAPRQITDAGSNCQYPAPAADRLVATCSRGNQLEIYELPLDGAVPTSWNAERVRAELRLESSRSEQLLLYRHALGDATSTQEQVEIMLRLILGHLESEEFDAAEFYAHELAAVTDQASAGLGAPLLALVEHRRGRGAHERGRVLEKFASEERARIEAMPERADESPAARAMNHLVRSEIADALGDKAPARAELERVALDPQLPPAVLRATYLRADALYRSLDDRAALFDICRRLAESPQLDPHDQLEYARAAARALVRGLPYREALTSLAEARQVAAGDDLDFALELNQHLLAMRGSPPQAEVEAEAPILAFYAKQTRADRKRALVLEAVQGATDAAADDLIAALAERYLDDAPNGTQERHRAERLYRRMLLGRAFERSARADLAGAQADFDAVFRRTGDLEAAVGSIELRLREGKRPAEIGAELASHVKPDSPPAHFIEAYLIASELPGLQGQAHTHAVKKALGLLRRSRSSFRYKVSAQMLQAYVLHESYLRTGQLEEAEQANVLYLMAHELAQSHPRYLAAALGQLALLHLEVGNFRIALSYFEEREKLPHTEDIDAFAMRLGMARALLHVGRPQESAALAEQALALVARVPSLAPFRALALDRSALYNLAAARYERALALYDQELPLLAKGDSTAERRNQLVVRLARSAAAVGGNQPLRALEDLALVEPQLDDPDILAALALPYGTQERAVRSYRSIAAGLRANASAALGRTHEAALALQRKHGLLEEQLASTGRDEDLRALTLVEARLAETAASARDFQSAAQWLGRALQHADTLAARLHTGLDLDQLRVLQLGAELHLAARMPLPFDLTQRLAQAYEKLVAHPQPSLRVYQNWFAVFLALDATTTARSTPVPP